MNNCQRPYQANGNCNCQMNRPEPRHMRPDNCQMHQELHQMRPDNCQMRPEPRQMRPNNCQMRPEPCKMRPDNCQARPEPCKTRPDNCQVRPEPCKTKPDHCQMRPEPDRNCNCNCNTKRPPSKAQMLNHINEVSFAVDDILLYLDTHPCDQEALAFYRENAKKRNEALKEYAKYYGPLTIDTAVDSDSDSWEWVNQPWPWEGGAC